MDMYKRSKFPPREFESLDYQYLKGLIENYSGSRNKKKRIYIGIKGWSYSSVGCALILMPVEDELHLYPYKGYSLDILLRWLPNGELHLQNYRRLSRIRSGRYFRTHLLRKDKMPPNDNDVYLHGVPQPPASLVPDEHIFKLEQTARKLAAELLPPQTRYYWWTSTNKGKMKFHLSLQFLPSIDKVSSKKCLDFFHHQMYDLYTTEGMVFPENRPYASELLYTPHSHTEALVLSS